MYATMVTVPTIVTSNRRAWPGRACISLPGPKSPRATPRASNNLGAGVIQGRPWPPFFGASLLFFRASIFLAGPSV